MYKFFIFILKKTIIKKQLLQSNQMLSSSQYQSTKQSSDLAELHEIFDKKNSDKSVKPNKKQYVKKINNKYGQKQESNKVYSKDNLTQSNVFDQQKTDQKQQKQEKSYSQQHVSTNKNQHQYPQYWEFSAYNLQKCYNRVLQFLNNKHFQLEEPSNKDIIKQLQIKFGNEFWVTIFQAFKFFVQKKFNFIFVQENEKFKIAHLQFMHSNIVRSFKQKDDKPVDHNYQLRTTRKYTYMTEQKNSTLSINLITGEIISQFIKAPIIFGNSEYQQFLSVVMQAIQDSRKGFKYIKITGQPLGLQIQAKYHNNEWFLSTRSSLRVNELKCRSDFTLYQTFIDLLQAYDLSIDNLDKNFSPNYTPLPVYDQLYLISVFDTKNKASATEDPLKQSKIPKLPKLNVDLNGDFYSKKQTIHDAIHTLLTQYSTEEPIFSILIKINNQFYEIQSEVANIFYSMIERLSKYKNQEIDNQQYQELIQKELHQLSEQFPNNNYLQFIINSKNQVEQVHSE